jgi:hypothetical protein
MRPGKILVKDKGVAHDRGNFVAALIYEIHRFDNLSWSI